MASTEDGAPNDTTTAVTLQRENNIHSLSIYDDFNSKKSYILLIKIYIKVKIVKEVHQLNQLAPTAMD